MPFVLLTRFALQDQPYYGITYRANVTTNSQLFVNPSFLHEATESYVTEQSGPLANSAGNWIGRLNLLYIVRDRWLIFSNPRL